MQQLEWKWNQQNKFNRRSQVSFLITTLPQETDPVKKADLCSLKAVMTTLLWNHITQSTDNYICTLCDLTQSGTEIKVKQQIK